MGKRSQAKQRKKQEQQHRAGIQADIARFMDQAVAEPGEADPTGMVGFGATIVAAMLSIRQEETDRAQEQNEQASHD